MWCGNLEVLVNCCLWSLFSRFTSTLTGELEGSTASTGSRGFSGLRGSRGPSTLAVHFLSTLLSMKNSKTYIFVLKTDSLTSSWVWGEADLEKVVTVNDSDFNWLAAVHCVFASSSAMFSNFLYYFLGLKTNKFKSTIYWIFLNTQLCTGLLFFLH